VTRTNNGIFGKPFRMHGIGSSPIPSSSYTSFFSPGGPHQVALFFLSIGPFIKKVMALASKTNSHPQHIAGSIETAVDIIGPETI